MGLLIQVNQILMRDMLAFFELFLEILIPFNK